MLDQFERSITYLRVSVTDFCNMRCVYCMPPEGVEKKAHSEILSVDEIEEIVSAAAELGISKVRITGGEPLVRRGIVEIARRTANTPGIKEVCMTTNGSLLPEFAEDLKAAGVSRLNISLDTLDPVRFSEITRGANIADVLRGIEAAKAVGFEKIKINSVLTSAVSTDEITGLIDYAKTGGYHLRFIEIMPIGENAAFTSGEYIDNSAILKAAPELEPTGETDGVAMIYRIPGYTATVGLISPISRHFCGTCNRIRVTADGRLKPCLHSGEEIRLKGLSGLELIEALSGAIYRKPRRHGLKGDNFSDAIRNMNAIGG